jgi:hypothetical protein
VGWNRGREGGEFFFFFDNMEKEASCAEEEEMSWIFQAGAGTRCLARLPGLHCSVLPCAVSMPKGQVWPSSHPGRHDRRGNASLAPEVRP